MSYHLYVNVLSENDSILGSLYDLLSVCVRDCMGGRFTTHSTETYSSPLVEKSYLEVYDFFVSMYVTHYR